MKTMPMMSLFILFLMGAGILQGQLPKLDTEGCYHVECPGYFRLKGVEFKGNVHEYVTGGSCKVTISCKNDENVASYYLPFEIKGRWDGQTASESVELHKRDGGIAAGKTHLTCAQDPWVSPIACDRSGQSVTGEAFSDPSFIKISSSTTFPISAAWLSEAERQELRAKLLHLPPTVTSPKSDQECAGGKALIQVSIVHPPGDIEDRDLSVEIELTKKAWPGSPEAEPVRNDVLDVKNGYALKSIPLTEGEWFLKARSKGSGFATDWSPLTPFSVKGISKLPLPVILMPSADQIFKDGKLIFQAQVAVPHSDPAPETWYAEVEISKLVWPGAPPVKITASVRIVNGYALKSFPLEVSGYKIRARTVRAGRAGDWTKDVPCTINEAGTEAPPSPKTPIEKMKRK